MTRFFDWIELMPRWRFALLIVGLFVTAAAWSYSLGTSQSPDRDVVVPQTVAPAVEVDVP